MSVPVAAANLLLDKLSQVITHKSEMIADVEDNILRLRREVGNIKELMVEMTRFHSDSETLKQTVGEIRQILDEAEDAVDTYLIQASVQKSRFVVSKYFHQVTDYPVMLRALEKQIASIAEKVKQINEDKLRTGFEVLRYLSISTEQDQASQQKIACKVRRDCVIGFDESAREVTELLKTGSNEDFEVITISGMAGLGKTTLAKKVYKEMSGKFEIRAFVYVSQECDREELLLQLLDCFNLPDDSVKKMDKSQLEEHVKNQLKEKHYLVVLDDVWEARDWDIWKRLFPTNEGKKCRVLITTRNARLAEHVNPGNSASLYRLELLNENLSEKLLMMKVFPEENSSDIEKQEHAKIFALRCKGSPMALVLIGGVLMNDLSTKWWKHVDDYLTRDGSDLVKVIEMAYQLLPNHLKPCFLYMSMFCENSVIRAWKLVRLWVSEGFIQGDGDDGRMEDTAMDYLEELVQKGLVMVEQRGSNGKIKSCRMHTALRDFCKNKAVEEDVFREPNLESSTLDKTRRLCISANVIAYVETQPSGTLVRSFLAFGRKGDIDAKTFSTIPKSFKLLRVLEAQSLMCSRFPTDLLNLILLKYLAISFDTSSLPLEFSALWNLQTLRVCTTSPALEIKTDLWKMPQFRHFHSNVPATLTDSGTKSMKSKEGSVSRNNSSRSSPRHTKNRTESASSSNSNIQTLCMVAPESCKNDVFHRTPKLKKLGICGDLSKLFIESSFFQLDTLTSLESLKLQSNQEVPSLLRRHFPPSLRKLTLMKTLRKWEEMSELSNLKSLAVLKLKEFAFQGSEWTTVGGCFGSLEYLAIGQTDLKVWKVSKDHFPKLKNLMLDGIDEAIPLKLKEVFSSQLESVVIYCDITPSADLETLCKSPSNFQLIQRI